MRAFMEGIGRACEAAAKDLAPVGATKKLRDGIDHKVEREDGAWMVNVYFDQFYGIFQEFGTSHHPAHPFLRPGVLKVIGPLGGRLGDDGPS